MKVNKIIAGIMAVCVMGFSVPYVSGFMDKSITASAEDIYELLTYNNYGDYIEIVRCDDSATEVIIPSDIEGVPVTNIKFNAFCNCSYLESVVIPDSVKVIGERAFFGCTSLTSIEIPDSVTSIEYGAFYNCTSLVSIKIPDSLTDFGGQVFHDTLWLEEKRNENPLVIVNGILIDGATCTGDVAISDSVISIGNDAFRDCSGLTSAVIPNSVTSIGYNAFWGCQSLTSIVIPDSLISIGDSAFGYSGLTSIRLPDSVNTIGVNAFYNCTDLKSVEISDSLSVIDEKTFFNCSALKSVEIPENVKSIKYNAFCNCSDLTEMIILNPQCNIDYYNSTISNGYDSSYYFNGTIYSGEGSAVQAYAEKYGYNFETLDKVPEKEISLGDINDDGFVNAVDATMALIEYAELSTDNPSTLTENQKKSADVNGDGEVNAVDATIISQYYAYVSTDGTDPIEKFIQSLDV
ncbi:MAG: leucine-rich repeat protein [Ruminococcus flavefaciens]|nr:leucine-rich repeat protein [Ruminococcus flavefaciens]